MEEIGQKGSSQFWIHGIKRGEAMVSFLKSKIGSLEEKEVLDIGSGAGGISIVFAQKCKRIVSLDSGADNVEFIRQRLEEKNIKNIELLLGNAIKLPFHDEEFDIVILNGVLEWIPYTRGKEPFSLQCRALAEAFRVLKKRGLLYLATENRWYPFNFLRDPHVHIPFVCMLPRKIANFVSFIFSRKPYENFIYSYWKLKNLIKESGFSRVDIYAPLIHYQYPVIIKDLEKRCSLSKVDRDNLYLKYSKMKLTRCLKIKIFFLRIVFFLRITKMFIHGFLVLGYKSNS
ncbi:MAG: methyltransferase domain-containing protein [Omnitrophica bacterium]|nr:methyltransferase domain-containing protein [Candidatus Omnitrophota bacterium]